MCEFNQKVVELINLVNDLETENINKAAKIIFNALKEKKVVHVFATGHSHMFAEELFYRAGGLVPVDPILLPFLMSLSEKSKQRQLQKSKSLLLLQ